MTGYKLGSMDPTLAPRSLPPSIDATLDLLASADYLADRSLATVLFLALKMSRPLFLEGEAGVGKTEIAKVLSSTLGRRLIRLQCYEGQNTPGTVLVRFITRGAATPGLPVGWTVDLFPNFTIRPGDVVEINGTRLNLLGPANRFTTVVNGYFKVDQFRLPMFIGATAE